MSKILGFKAAEEIQGENIIEYPLSNSKNKILFEIRSDKETLTLCSEDGDIGMKIEFVNGIPELRLNFGKVKFESLDDFSLKCKNIDLQAQGDVSINSKGVMDIISNKKTKIKSDDDIQLNGERILLNCTEI